ncbi:MAG: FAD-dependent oxidoreductase [Deltaproteobacteria bacterium]
MIEVRDVDVVVVGAGLAGLVAATELRQAGRTVTIVEARDRVGGRTFTTQAGGISVELGGQWVGPGQPRVLALLDHLGIRTSPQFDEGRSLLELHGRLRSYAGTIPSLPLTALLETQRVISRLDRMARLLDPAAPWAAKHAARWDSQTLGSWAARSVHSRLARSLLFVTARSVLCVEPAETSMLYLLFYIRSAGGLMKLVEVGDGFQQDRIEGGAQSLSEGLARRLGWSLRLAEPVRAVQQTADGVTVSTEQGVHRAARAIVTVPPAMVASIDLGSGVWAERQWLADKASMGSSIKFVAVYDRPFWRERGLSGQMVGDGGPVQMVFDGSRENPASLVGFIMGEQGRQWSARSDDQRRVAVLADLARLFGPEAGTARAYVDKDWNRDPWSRGCPVNSFPPGALTALGPYLRRPSGRVHWAGTETAVAAAGFMDGAVESGQRAAAEVSSAL